MTKDLDKKVAHAMELHYERGFIDGMQKQMQSSVDMAVNRMAQTQEPVPPPWWTAVENILNEYGLQAIDFVADFKQALAQTQEPVACAECERLKDALKRANGLAEHFERAWYLRGDEIELLKAQTEQEPVAWTLADKVRQDLDRQSCPDAFMRIAVESIVKHHPPQRTWVDLTDEEIQVVAKQARSKDHAVTLTNKLLKEKNT
jgi:hypothetical protein